MKGLSKQVFTQKKYLRQGTKYLKLVYLELEHDVAVAYLDYVLAFFSKTKSSNNSIIILK
jgi:hypothetical protein